MKKYPARFVVIVCFFLVILCILIGRMYDLTVLNRPFLQGQGNARSVRIIDIPAYRGMITDRQGVPLAISTPVKSVWVNPQMFKPSHLQLEKLSKLLHIPIKQLSKHIATKNGREFIYLQRQISPILAKKIEDLKIKGLHFQEEFKRYYPQGENIAQLIGFTDVDDHGIEGLELAFQSWLMGMSGKKRVLKDRLGFVIEELDVLKDPRPGHDLQLSIDGRIQYFAYHALQDTVSKFGAKSGTVIVLDTQNGEVLAIANVPSFNPNARGQYSLDHYRNKALTDTFEPGSVIKPLSIASALESGQFTPHTVIDTRPSWMTVNGHTIKDIHDYGILDVTGVLRYSSNVGVSKMILANPPERLLNVLKQSGIGTRTESGYPGESEGTLVHVRDANPFVLATLSFGYGMSVTALQLAKSYLVFANEGRLLPVSFLHYENQKQEGVQVIAAKTAKNVLAMMETVVNMDGTGKQAKISGYRVAGKTGTARIAGRKGYEANRHIASFVGIAPASKPRLIVAVIIHEPSRVGYYGGAVAAPLFANVMGVALRILNIAPDERATT